MAAVGTHRLFVSLLVVGAIVRVLTMVAYTPALFFNDSWGYVFTAFTGDPVSLSYLRPNGYPVLIRVLTFPGRDLLELIALQHLAGLITGSLVYLALIRARVPRGLAAAAAALVILDGYMITVEQYVMPEAFFTLTLLSAALVVAWPRLDPPEAAVSKPTLRRMVVAGVLLGAAAIQREAALFAAPVFLVYLFSARVGLQALAAFAVALVVPVLAYASIYDARVGVFGLSETSGWTLYGRVAGFADCAGAAIPAGERALCETTAQRRSHPDSPTWYIWVGSSPAARLFHGGHQTRETQEHANTILSAFARRIILHQPLGYARAVADDALRYFTPGATPFNDAFSATSLPASAAAEPRNERDRQRVLPTVRPAVRSPAGLVRAYRDVIHLPRPALALLAVVSLIAVALRMVTRKEVLLLAGSGLALVVGTAATAGFGLRYLLPAVPLLGVGGSLALWALVVAGRRPATGRAP